LHYTIHPKMHLRRLALGMRVLLTLFLVCMLLGLWISALKYTHRAEFSAEGADLYYRGNLEDDDPSSEALLPGEEEAWTLHEPKSTAFLVDVTHPHAFSVPVLFFILFHFLALTRLREWQKVSFHLYGFLSLILAFGAPWLVVRDERFAALFVISGVNLLLCLLAVIGILLWETWMAPAESRSGQG